MATAKGNIFQVNVSTARAAALTNSAGNYPNVLYFPTDSDTIVFNGKEYSLIQKTGVPQPGGFMTTGGLTIGLKGKNGGAGSFSEQHISTLAMGMNSHAEGENTKANGQASHSEGYNTKANINGAHAEGHTTVANGPQSHAEGWGTIANNDSEHAEGYFNISHADKTLHSVGIGSDEENRMNAQEIFKDGSFFIKGLGGYDGTNAPTAKPLQRLLNGVVTLKDAVGGKEADYTWLDNVTEGGAYTDEFSVGPLSWRKWIGISTDSTAKTPLQFVMIINYGISGFNISYKIRTYNSITKKWGTWIPYSFGEGASDNIVQYSYPGVLHQFITSGIQGFTGIASSFISLGSTTPVILPLKDLLQGGTIYDNSTYEGEDESVLASAYNYNGDILYVKLVVTNSTSTSLTEYYLAIKTSDDTVKYLGKSTINLSR